MHLGPRGDRKQWVRRCCRHRHRRWSRRRRRWSRRRLPEPIDGLDWLELRQNVTRSLQQERLSQLLLIAAAGVSILLTSLLLRPVL